MVMTIVTILPPHRWDVNGDDRNILYVFVCEVCVWTVYSGVQKEV